MSSAVQSLQDAVDAIPYWYHKIELPGGVVTPGWAPMAAEAYRLPSDMSGESVLDIGAWDGYWSFEAAKRGASSVYAVDNFSDTIGDEIQAKRTEWQTLKLCRDALGYQDIIKPVALDIEKQDLFGYYDRVFCFGVLYHLRNPLAALEKIRNVCAGTLHVECAILDGMASAYDRDYVYSGNECVAEFYPGKEYGCNATNWWVPTLRCLGGWVLAAGFKNVRAWKLTNDPTHVSHLRGFIEATV